MKKLFWPSVLLVFLWVLGTSGAVRADVFTTPHFVAPGDFSIGVEPESTFSQGAGMGGNLHYTHGLNDMMNLNVRLGTSTGGFRIFRAGAGLTLDFFPDIEGQPGIGIEGRALFSNLYDGSSQLDLQAVPYIHKSLKLQSGSEIEPFFAIPFGIGFNAGRYLGVSSVAFGTMFKSTPNFRYVLELGVPINNSTTYVSGGVAYYP